MSAAEARHLIERGRDILIDELQRNGDVERTSELRRLLDMHGEVLAALDAAGSGPRHFSRVVGYPGKLTDEAVTDIRRRASEGESGKDLAAFYGVSSAHVSRIIRGLVRKDCPGPVRRRKIHPTQEQ